jgi:hypothetical protein
MAQPQTGMSQLQTGMSQPQKHDAVRRNQLLGALEPATRERINPHLRPVRLKLGEIVCEAGGVLEHAYFPEGCVLSLLTVLENGSAIETANIGREGAFGLFAAMYSRVSFNRCLVQLAGPMVRCPIAVLRSAFTSSEHVRDLLCQLFRDTAVAGPAECRLQCTAFNRGENVPMAAYDA